MTPISRSYWPGFEMRLPWPHHASPGRNSAARSQASKVQRRCRRMDAEHADGCEPGMLLPVEGSETVASQPTPTRWPVTNPRVPRPSACIRVKPCLLCHPPHAVTRLPRSHRRTTTHAPAPMAPTTSSRYAAQGQNLMHPSAGRTRHLTPCVTVSRTTKRDARETPPAAAVADTPAVLPPAHRTRRDSPAPLLLQRAHPGPGHIARTFYRWTSAP